MQGVDNLPPSCLSASFTDCWDDTDGKSSSDSVFFAGEVDAGSASSIFSIKLYNKVLKGLLIMREMATDKPSFISFLHDNPSGVSVKSASGKSL